MEGRKNDGVDAVGGSSLLTRVSQRHPHPTKQSVHLSSDTHKSVEFLREAGTLGKNVFENPYKKPMFSFNRRNQY